MGWLFFCTSGTPSCLEAVGEGKRHLGLMGRVGVCWAVCVCVCKFCGIQTATALLLGSTEWAPKPVQRAFPLGSVIPPEARGLNLREKGTHHLNSKQFLCFLHRIVWSFIEFSLSLFCHKIIGILRS